MSRNALVWSLISMTVLCMATAYAFFVLGAVAGRDGMGDTASQVLLIPLFTGTVICFTLAPELRGKSLRTATRSERIAIAVFAGATVVLGISLLMFRRIAG
jgi:hypothetical protein